VAGGKTAADIKSLRVPAEKTNGPFSNRSSFPQSSMPALGRTNLRARLLWSISALTFAVVVVLLLANQLSERKATRAVLSRLDSESGKQQQEQQSAIQTICAKQLERAGEALRLKGESVAALVAKLARIPLVTEDTGRLDEMCRLACGDKDVVLPMSPTRAARCSVRTRTRMVRSCCACCRARRPSVRRRSQALCAAPPACKRRARMWSTKRLRSAVSVCSSRPARPSRCATTRARPSTPWRTAAQALHTTCWRACRPSTPQRSASRSHRTSVWEPWPCV